jgi:probable rRNA maturation factor
MASTVRLQFAEGTRQPLAALDRPMLRRLITRAARLTLRRQQVRTAELSITLLDDDGIADLNVRFLSHEGPTDVLSFGLWEGDEDPVGDIYIGAEQALRQSSAAGVGAEEEFVRLTVHGVLHVLGYEHEDGDGRMQSEMWQLQESIVASVFEA